jgi:F-type H+-transporting ATPase subunit alpha
VVSITAANKGHLDKLEVEDIGAFEAGLHQFLKANHGDLLDTIREKGSLDDAGNKKLDEAMSTFTADFVAGKGGADEVSAAPVASAKVDAAEQAAAR